MDLSGKIALVTGAGRGIGRQIALTLAGYGATVIVNYNGSKEKAEETVKEIEENGGQAEAIQCSVADFSQSRELIDAIVKKYGRLDILVNNAGITRDNLIMKMSEDDFDAVVATNLKGAFNCVKHVSRQMLKQRSGRSSISPRFQASWGMQARPITAPPRRGSSALQNPWPGSWEAAGSRPTQWLPVLSIQK